MRVALVHDFLSQRGGAERVVLALAKVLADPVIVTALYSPEQTYPEFADMEIQAVRRASGSEARRFRSRVLSYPRTFRALDLAGFDVAVISSSSFAHHVRHPRSAVYWHTPPRFLYDAGAYFPSLPIRALAAAAGSPLRPTDRRAAKGHLVHAANSQRTAAKLRRLYKIDSQVLYPPLASGALPVTLSPVGGSPSALVVSRLLPYKRIDVAIAACRSLGIPLTVVGDGPDRSRLTHLADDSVRFRHDLTNEELAAAYVQHSVVICPGQEDFGYIPAEAAYAGRPVVAAAGGGAEETVLHGSTGVLVAGDDPEAWADAIKWVLAQDWDPTELRDASARFSAAEFAIGVSRWLAPIIDPPLIMQPGGNDPQPLARSTDLTAGAS